MQTASVMTSGNSIVIVLPKRYRERNAIHAGDKVLIDFPSEETMTIHPLKTTQNKKLRAAQAFAQEVNSWEVVGFVPQTKEEEQAMLAERYV